MDNSHPGNVIFLSGSGNTTYYTIALLSLVWPIFVVSFFAKSEDGDRLSAKTSTVSGRYADVQRFRGGFVSKAHILCITLDSRLESNEERQDAWITLIREM